MTSLSLVHCDHSLLLNYFLFQLQISTLCISMLSKAIRFEACWCTPQCRRRQTSPRSNPQTSLQVHATCHAAEQAPLSDGPFRSSSHRDHPGHTCRDLRGQGGCQLQLGRLGMTTLVPQSQAKLFCLRQAWPCAQPCHSNVKANSIIDGTNDKNPGFDKVTRAKWMRKRTLELQYPICQFVKVSRCCPASWRLAQQTKLLQNLASV